MKLENKKIIVTGGSSGIGKQTALQLIEKGAKILITGRDESKLKSVADEIGADYLAFDMGDLDSLEAYANTCLKKLDGIDAIINNAGLGKFNLLGDISAKEFIDIFNTNVFGLTLFTQAFLTTFKSQKSGNIINIGSSAAVKGFKYGSVYSASKFAVRSLTQCWQAELREYNIRVSLVNPSEVTTAFNSESREEREEVANKLTPKEIADVIVSSLEMDNRGFVTETNVWATNPF